jgi:hypothetical protein
LSSAASNGTLVLEQFDRFVRIDDRATHSHNINPNWKQQFDTVISFSTPDKSLLKTRLEQLSVYLDLPKVNDIAKVLLQVKAKNALVNRFSVLNHIASSVFTF